MLPDADFSDPTWGVLDRPGFSIEFNMGDDGIISSFALQVRGGGDAMAVVAELLEALHLSGIDPQSESGLFSIAEGTAGFERWQAYRDRALQEGPAGT